MKELLLNLCQLNGPSSEENSVREFIISKIKDHCEYKIDALGNIIAYKKGKKRAKAKLMLDAHMDEVGVIITSVTESGFLKFSDIGSIPVANLLGSKVKLGEVTGVIGCKPAHFCKGEEEKNMPEKDTLYIDIGADSKDQALKAVSIGDMGVIESEFTWLGGNRFKAKAIDDRAGVAVLISLLKEDSEYDFYATFTVQEEVGLRGAKTATYAVDPQFAICLECTTAADLCGVAEEDKVCKLGGGPAVSFMDKATLYNKELYNAALNCGVLAQSKNAVAGGNNSGAIHLTREGVKTVVMSLPCRYIHSQSCVADYDDLQNLKLLAGKMKDKICSGEFLK